jgi:hypothetical protein
MKPAPEPRANPRVYLVPSSRLDVPGRTTELGIGPSTPANETANADGDGTEERPYPLVQSKPQGPEEPASGNAPISSPGTSFERAAEELIEESVTTDWTEPLAPAPPIAPSVVAPPVAMTSPVPLVPAAPLARPEPRREHADDDAPPFPRARTTLRARLAHWAAFLMFAGVLGVGVVALDRALSTRNRSELAPTEPAPALRPAPAAMTPSIGAAVPEPILPPEAETAPLAPAANPRVLPPRRASRAAAAAATAKADWTSAPPPESARAPSEASDTGRLSPPATEDSATLSINSIPISNISVDGESFGSTPRKLNITPGKHSVVFSHPELGQKTVTVDVAPGGAGVAAVKF